MSTIGNRSKARIVVGLVVAVLAAGCGTRVTGVSTASQGAALGAGPAGGDLAAGTGAGLDTGAPGATGSGADAGSGSSGGQGGAKGAAGVGGSSPGASSVAGAVTQAATGGNTQGVTDTEITFGASGPLSGITGFLGSEAFGAIDAYFQSINAQGGINGRKLRLITLDDRFDSSQTLANVRKLWEQNKVHAIFLAFGDPVADYVTQHKIPTIVFGVTPKSFSSRYPTVYPIVGNALIWTQEAIAGLKDKGIFKQGMRVGMLYDTSILDVTPYVPFLKQAWQDAGATVVSTDPFNLTDGDCTSLVLKMKQMKIDYWDFQGLGWVLCVSAASRQQYRPTIGWGDWPTSIGGLATQVGPWVDGVWGGSQGDTPTGAPRTKTAGDDAYLNAIARYHPNLNNDSDLESPATIGYYSGAELLAGAIKTEGQHVTVEGTDAAVANVSNFDTGITPPIISMSPTCKTGSELVWIGRWHWDSANNKAVRTPETGYFDSPDKARYGGKCFLTMTSAKLG